MGYEIKFLYATDDPLSVAGEGPARQGPRGRWLHRHADRLDRGEDP